jgi:endonuclease YncB( thermonuclease family)
MLLAHGFKIDILAELVRDGLATAYRQPLKAGERQIEAALFRITDTGRRAIEE